MSILPALTAVQTIRALKRGGFVEDRQKGSHLILINPTTKVRTVVPIHSGKTIAKPLLKDIINDADLSIEQFLDLL